MMSMLELGQRMIRGELPHPPMARLVGFLARQIEPGHAVFELDVDERHHNPMGTLHGGIYCDLADAAMGFAYAATLQSSESFTTVELKINFFRAVREGRLRAEARVIWSGKTLGYLECNVTDAQGRLVARSASTCMKLSTDPTRQVQSDGEKDATGASHS